jgi:hypothetical protein
LHTTTTGRSLGSSVEFGLTAGTGEREGDYLFTACANSDSGANNIVPLGGFVTFRFQTKVTATTLTAAHFGLDGVLGMGAIRRRREGEVTEDEVA